MMKTCIAIPMKDPGQSKQRLASVLNPDQRQTLALTLFRQTLRFLNQHFSDYQVLVVTASSRIAAIAEGYGAALLIEQEGTGLNGAASLAAQWSLDHGFDSQLLIPADIPELSKAEVGQLLERSPKSPSVLVCPASDGGTNALLTTPPNVVPFQFGRDSSIAHLKAAKEQLVFCELLQLEKLTFDLDTPDDLQHWTQMLASTFGGKTLAAITLSGRTNLQQGAI
ncbi:2-phospho-L-lactate guanylyltransferase [Motiliproteus sp. MSK22-1]|uniref:2-phospho-L-lactate guanylyltransferase n=1 Tax=Motiliproteus sp. MSK22-1 TaxID=1897630 RepID=UPI0009775142|nr:2-phospho-L-lactate guanylyltransferase [Motiliproteus sp. MSK22-1]OMH39396.1 2-phospho-L-lactate guanylyltransferase [Motiliproteus sp. MSK22-1]